MSQLKETIAAEASPKRVAFDQAFSKRVPKPLLDKAMNSQWKVWPIDPKKLSAPPVMQSYLHPVNNASVRNWIVGAFAACTVTFLMCNPRRETPHTDNEQWRRASEARGKARGSDPYTTSAKF